MSDDRPDQDLSYRAVVQPGFVFVQHFIDTIMKASFITLLSLFFAVNMAQAQVASCTGKVLLQGAYDPNTSLMRTQLIQQSGFPLQQPYGNSPWLYPGTEYITATPAGMVDWILLELRSSPDTAIARIAAILLADGTIRDASGDSVLRFSVPPGQYYLAILHRSHLPTMTAAKLNIQNGVKLDFSDTTLAVFGNCMISLGTEKRGMIGGDVNQDRMLKYSGSGNDRSPVLQRILTVVGGTAINATTPGYYPEDLRMDGVMKYSGSGNDPSLIIQNIIALTGSSAINSTHTASVPHAMFVPYQAFTCGNTLNDTRDGQQYPTIQIGTQCWMARNLNAGTMVNSNNTGSTHSDVSNNGIIEKYCYANDIANCSNYGGLYDWNEMMDYSTAPGSQGVCPSGWHIPTDAEWCTMTTFLDAGVNCTDWNWSGFDVGGRLKETGFIHWTSPNTGATNSSGFTAYGSGGRDSGGGFADLKDFAYFWCSTEYTAARGIRRYLSFDSPEIYRLNTNKAAGFSVRCILD